MPDCCSTAGAFHGSAPTTAAAGRTRHTVSRHHIRSRRLCLGNRAPPRGLSRRRGHDRRRSHRTGSALRRTPDRYASRSVMGSAVSPRTRPPPPTAPVSFDIPISTRWRSSSTRYAPCLATETPSTCLRCRGRPRTSRSQGPGNTYYSAADPGRSGSALHAARCSMVRSGSLISLRAPTG